MGVRIYPALKGSYFRGDYKVNIQGTGGSAS